MLKIDKGVPHPTGSRGNAKYPFAQMVVGDSFYCEGVDEGSLRTAVKVGGKRLGMQFSARKEGNGLRVWRLA